MSKQDVGSHKNTPHHGQPSLHPLSDGVRHMALVLSVYLSLLFGWELCSGLWDMHSSTFSPKGEILSLSHKPRESNK